VKNLQRVDLESHKSLIAIHETICSFLLYIIGGKCSSSLEQATYFVLQEEKPIGFCQKYKYRFILKKK